MKSPTILALALSLLLASSFAACTLVTEVDRSLINSEGGSNAQGGDDGTGATSQGGDGSGGTPAGGAGGAGGPGGAGGAE